MSKIKVKLQHPENFSGDTLVLIDGVVALSYGPRVVNKENGEVESCPLNVSPAFFCIHTLHYEKPPYWVTNVLTREVAHDLIPYVVSLWLTLCGIETGYQSNQLKELIEATKKACKIKLDPIVR